jgi:hypothetical protein
MHVEQTYRKICTWTQEHSFSHLTDPLTLIDKTDESCVKISSIEGRQVPSSFIILSL